MFSAGGMVVALLLPMLIIITGFIVPAGGVDFDQLDTLFNNPLVRLIVLGVAFLSFFHAAHRIRHTLKDIGLRSVATLLAVVCYAAALAGTVWAALVVL
jgi:fumarate reductase subunit D